MADAAIHPFAAACYFLRTAGLTWILCEGGRCWGTKRWGNNLFWTPFAFVWSVGWGSLGNALAKSDRLPSIPAYEAAALLGIPSGLLGYWACRRFLSPQEKGPMIADGLLQDILDTWKISQNHPGSNWRAIHAGSALFIGAGLLIASAWCLYSDWPTLFRAAWFFFLSWLPLAYWRYLLPTAKHIADVHRILREKISHKSRKNHERLTMSSSKAISIISITLGLVSVPLFLFSLFCILWGIFCFMGGPEGRVGSRDSFIWGSGFVFLGAVSAFCAYWLAKKSIFLFRNG